MTDVNNSIANEYELDMELQIKDVDIDKCTIEQLEPDHIDQEEQLNDSSRYEQQIHNTEEIRKSESEEEKCIENFILGKTIGQGSFGKVKIGTHTLTKEKVAIKIMNKNKFDEEDFKNIKKEISVMKRIRHKNIIQFYEMIETEDKLYIIMEFAENGDLYEYISKNNKITDERLACKYFQQIINALEYMHSINIVHRDIKPENMLFDYKNEIKLTDFGLSTFYNDNQLLTTPCGTPTYVPPEIFKGEEYHGMFSDIWSAGVVLYAMLCGYLPFGDSNENILQRRIIKGDYEIPDFISEDAKELLKGLLKVDPLERYDFDMIKKTKWFGMVNYIFYPGIFIDKHVLPIDEKILDLLENIYNLEKKTVRYFLLNNDFNELTTSYYMMLRRYVKEGGKSISDLVSKEYLDYIQDPNNLYNKDYLNIINQENESINYSDIQIAKQLIKNSSSLLNNFIIKEITTNARNSLNTYYLANRATINDSNIIDEIDVELSRLPRKTVFHRCDNINPNIFLDLLERKTLKLAEKETIDCDRLLDDFVRKKSKIETHHRNSIKFNFENLEVIKDQISENNSEMSRYISNGSDNNDDLKNINVDAVYEIPLYLDDLKKPGVVKKKPKNGKKSNKKNEKNEKTKKIKIDPKKYNIYLNKKVKKKEKNSDKKENNNIIRIAIQLPNKKCEDPLQTEHDFIKTEPCAQHVNAVSQTSKGDNSTIETNLNKNNLNTSVNDNTVCLTDVNDIVHQRDTNKDRKKENKHTNNTYKINKFTNLTDKKKKPKAREDKSNSYDNSNIKANKIKHHTTLSDDRKKINFTERSKINPVKIQKKPLSTSSNKDKGKTSRSKSPNFNSNNNYKENPPENLNNIVYTTEFLTYLSTHNKMPYSTKKTRFNYTPIKNNIKTFQITRENSVSNILTEREEVKLKDYNGPIDLGCFFLLESDVLNKNLLKVLGKQRIIHISKKCYSYRCNKEGVKFKINFYSLKDSKAIYIKFHRTQGTSFEFQQIISKILYDLKMTV